MIFIAQTLRTRLIEDSKNKTWELSEVIGSSLRHLMLVRNTEKIQETLEAHREERIVHREGVHPGQERQGRLLLQQERDRHGDRPVPGRVLQRSATPRRGAIPQQTTMLMDYGQRPGAEERERHSQ